MPQALKCISHNTLGCNTQLPVLRLHSSETILPALFHSVSEASCLWLKQYQRVPSQELVLTADAQTHEVNPPMQQGQLLSNKVNALHVSPAAEEERILICLRSPEVLRQEGFVKTICFSIPHLLHALQFKRTHPNYLFASLPTSLVSETSTPPSSQTPTTTTIPSFHLHYLYLFLCPLVKIDGFYPGYMNS